VVAAPACRHRSGQSNSRGVGGKPSRPACSAGQFAALDRGRCLSTQRLVKATGRPADIGAFSDTTAILTGSAGTTISAIRVNTIPAPAGI
jgi:hypothetical protein